MKFPLVSRKRLESANVRIGILEATLRQAGEQYDALNFKHESLAATVNAWRADLTKLSGHNATLKATLGTARAELVTAKAEIKGQQAAIEAAEDKHEKAVTGLKLQFDQAAGVAQAEIDRLTAAFEKLTADYNELGKKIPAFRPKAIRWSGPDGARAAIERAAYAESPAGKQEAAAKLSI